MLVRESQQKWLQSAGQNCRKTDERYPFASCLLEEWNARIYFLDHIITRINGVPFFYREFSHGAACDKNKEDKMTGNTKSSHQSKDSDDADADRPSCAFDATWPEAISNAPEWQAWNRALLDEARRFQASQDTEDKVPDHWVLFPGPYDDSTVSVDLNLVIATLVVATIGRSYTYAHPMSEERAFNWLLKQGRELRPNDLFQPNSGWETWMKERIAQVVLENAEPSETNEDAARAAETEMRSSYWRVAHQGLEIIFTQDAVGYPECITTNATFPWLDLKPYLNPTFEIPQ